MKHPRKVIPANSGWYLVLWVYADNEELFNEATSLVPIVGWEMFASKIPEDEFTVSDYITSPISLGEIGVPNQPYGFKSPEGLYFNDEGCEMSKEQLLSILKRDAAYEAKRKGRLT